MTTGDSGTGDLAPAPLRVESGADPRWDVHALDARIDALAKAADAQRERAGKVVDGG